MQEKRCCYCSRPGHSAHECDLPRDVSVPDQPAVAQDSPAEGFNPWVGLFFNPAGAAGTTP
jgi:hypothetical protein